MHRRGSPTSWTLLLIIVVLYVVICECSLTRKRRVADEDYVCPDQSGNFADPRTCRKFYQCVDGYAYESRCPSGLYFDDEKKFCTFKNEAKCGPLPTTPAPVTEEPTNLAPDCNRKECVLPECFCSKDGTRIPGDLETSEIPQMILLTLDGAVNVNNIANYKRLFTKSRVNPNGCPITGTFFISHDYSDYQMIQQIYHDGHEIALNSVSVPQGLEDKGYEEWEKEMIGMRQILKRFANVSRDDISGMRAPYLKPGRNSQYEMLTDYGLLWDSSIAVPPIRVPVWPYTLNTKVPHDCKAGSCPTTSFPGLWEFPLNSHYVESMEGGHCPYLDQCVLHNHDAKDIEEWLKEDFQRHFSNNKAPYMLPFRTTWFQQAAQEQGLLKFIDWLLAKPDVWFLTMTQSLYWLVDPIPAINVKTIEAWDCKLKPQIEPACNLPKKCHLTFKPDGEKTQTRYMTTCFNCPRKYPWVLDYKGTGKYEDKYDPNTGRK